MNVKVLSRPLKKPIFNEDFSEAFKEHKGYLYFCLYFFLLTYVFLNFSIDYSHPEYFTGVIKFFLNSTTVIGGAALGIYVAILLITKRPKESPLKFSYRAVRDDILPSGNRWRILFGLTGLSFVVSAFLVLKGSIPNIQPFAYDVNFESLDRFVHFGYQPWELLQPVLGYEPVTLTLHRLYYLWFPVIFITFFWQVASQENNILRLQFITSFVACWVLIGGIMAVTLSSAGPIYFEKVVTEVSDPYANAMTYLGALDSKHGLFMFQIKESLWSFYINPTEGSSVKGISAMPSMHVAVSFLLVLFGWRKGLYHGIAYTLFFVAILLGSVHLLWHYAIDGYVSIIATTLIWLVCGKLIKPVN